MTASADQGLIMHLRAIGEANRLAFLVEHVAALVPRCANGAAFTDLGDGWLELVAVGADQRSLSAWLAAVLAAGQVSAVTRAPSALAVAGAGLTGPTERAQYLADLVELSDRALAVLRDNPIPPVPRDVVAAEVLAVHRHRGDPERSVAWQLAWLDPDASTPPAPRAVQVTARLAHGHCLRLTGGSPDRQDELALLRSCR